jgi:hypothetical protein
MAAAGMGGRRGSAAGTFWKFEGSVAIPHRGRQPRGQTSGRRCAAPPEIPVYPRGGWDWGAFNDVGCEIRLLLPVRFLLRAGSRCRPYRRGSQSTTLWTCSRYARPGVRVLLRRVAQAGFLGRFLACLISFCVFVVIILGHRMPPNSEGLIGWSGGAGARDRHVLDI